MTSLYKNLVNILARKLVMYNEFIVLLRKEWDIVTEYSLEDLQEVTKTKELLSLKMQALEEERLRVVQSISEGLKVPAEQLDISALIRLRKDPLNTKLAEYRKRLKAQIETIKNLNEKNRSLINLSSLCLKQSLSFIYRKDEESRFSYYANGMMRENRIQSRILSAQA